MSEVSEVVLEQSVVAPPVVEVPEVPPAPPAPEQLRYEFQPTDEQGRPLGGKQVILYTTPDELAEKLRDQNISILRKLREVTRKQRLGITDEDALPTDLEKFNRPIEFKPRELTLEERYQVSQDLNDPSKFVEARDRLFESAIGATPDELRKTLNEQQIISIQLLARSNAATFIETTPDFYNCEENLGTMTSWMLKNGLAPTVKNFEEAYSRLNGAGLLLESPIVREDAPARENTVANSQPPAAPVSRITEQEEPQEKRQLRVPSGLNSSIASSTGIVLETPTITLAQIDRMSSDDYKKACRDPKFVAIVEKLEAERRQRLATRQSA
jgi:hypothetical protein